MAVMNASAITAIRTAAVSALATRHLARKDVKTLAIVGTGVQASAHLDSMLAGGKYERVLIVGRSPERAREFVARSSRRDSVSLEAAADAEGAIRDAQVIVTATNSAEPVLRRDWIQPGTHINAVGSCVPRLRELDTATVAASRFIVDRRESALREAGDYLIPAQEGAFGPDHIRAELGEVLIGKETGRSAPEEITVFESLGLAIEDLASAQFLLKKEVEKGAGSRVHF
jgi:ornithine cyclodeaminase